MLYLHVFLAVFVATLIMLSINWGIDLAYRATTYGQSISVFADIAIIGQFLLLIISAYYAYYQTRLLARTNQADVLLRLSNVSRDLQLHTLQDATLAPLLIGARVLDVDTKQAIFVGIIINHYAVMFDIHRLGSMPSDLWNIFVNDMRQFFSLDVVRSRWTRLRNDQRPAFVHFVENELLRNSA